MKITIINQYNMPPEYGHLNRHYYIADELSRLGHEVTVIVGSKLHNSNIQMIKDKKPYLKYEVENFGYYFARTLDYENSKYKRVVAMFQFIKNSRKILKTIGNQDVIIGSSAHPLAAYLAIKMSKKQKALSVVEIRDLWPESIVAYNILRKNNLIVKFLYFFENWLYCKADRIVFTMEGGREYIKEKKMHTKKTYNVNLNKIYHINNGISLRIFNENLTKYKFNDTDLESNKFKIVYIGSIRKVNKLEILLEIAKSIKDSNIQFLVYGYGDRVDQLKTRVISENIQNIIFKGPINKKFIPYILSKVDMNIITGETLRLFNYGISPNKLFDYFASGKPTVCTFKSKYSLIEKYEAGIEYELLDYDIIARDIESIVSNDNLYNQMCEGAIKAAINHDYSVLAKRYQLCIEGKNEFI